MSASKAKSPNIVLIVVDTLRLDRGRALVQTLDNSIDYGWAVTPASWTLPAHVSILTGLYPSVHESYETPEMNSLLEITKLRNTKTTLMTRLKKLGYSTYGYSANSFISKAFGFDGFDVLKNWEVPLADLLFEMDEQSVKKFAKFVHTKRLGDFLMPLLRVLRKNPRLFFRTCYAEISTVIDRMIHKWPENKGLRNVTSFVKRAKFKEPFFLFLNILEVHEPYFKNDHLISGGFAVRQTSTLPREDLEKWIRGYDLGVNQVVRKLPRVFQALKDKGVFDNSLVILTSDHGQLLGEHGWIGHGVFLFDEIVQVPLIIKYPANMKVNFVRERTRSRISLANIPNLALDMAEARTTDSSLFSSHVFSEANFVRPGKMVCVYSEEGKVTYNFRKESVEEALLTEGKNSNDETVTLLVDRCVKFSNLNEKLIAATVVEKN